jgi:hypothetical protein
MKVLYVSLILLLASVSSHAQNWQIYSPAGKDFSLELPVPLQEVVHFEGDQGIGKTRDEDAPKWVTYYAGCQSKPMDRQFGIVVYDIPPKERQKVTTKMLEGLQSVVGDDDATPSSERQVEMNGFSGKEYTYAAKNDFDIYTRGRVFFTGHQIYVIVFRTRTADDLVSSDAERFLNSFSLRRRP